jgi:hypothetical protein
MGPRVASPPQSALARTLVLALALGAPACELLLPPQGNGAVFAIRGAMVANSCGANAPSSLPSLSFDAEIVLHQGSLRWAVPAAGIQASTRVDGATGAFRLVDDRVVVLRAEDRRRGIVACAVRRIDVIDGRVAGDFPPIDPAAREGGLADGALADATQLADGAPLSVGDAELRADGGAVTDAAVGDGGAPGAPALESLHETVGWAVIPGADCRDRLGVAEGQFITLPCEQRWNLDARYRPDRAVRR